MSRKYSQSIPGPHKTPHNPPTIPTGSDSAEIEQISALLVRCEAMLYEVAGRTLGIRFHPVVCARCGETGSLRGHWPDCDLRDLVREVRTTLEAGGITVAALQRPPLRRPGDTDADADTDTDTDTDENHVKETR